MSPDNAAHHVLIATLGAKPQVVTTALDLLMRGGHPIDEVIVLHTTGPNGPLASALQSLQDAFSSYPAYTSLRLHKLPLSDAGRALADVATEADAEAAFRAIYSALLGAKRSGRIVHLSIVGGRKVLAVYGMAAAQLLFDDEDRLWYVLAGGEFFSSGRLHPRPGDEAHLVRVPVLRWGTLSPMLTDLRAVDDPFVAVERRREAQLRQRLEEARGFVLGSLSAAEQRAVALLVREGLSDAEIAERLSLSQRTVERHLGEAYEKAEAHWSLDDVNRTQLVMLLGMYYSVAG